MRKITPGFAKVNKNCVILVRQNRLYIQTESGFDRILSCKNESEKHINFSDIIPTDMIFAADNEEYLLDYVTKGKCLLNSPYVVKPETCWINLVSNALDGGKLVGFDGILRGYKYNKAKSKIVKHSNTALDVISIDGKKMQAISNPDWTNSEMVNEYGDFYEFDTEYEFWKWMYTTDATPKS